MSGKITSKEVASQSKAKTSSKQKWGIPVIAVGLGVFSVLAALGIGVVAHHHTLHTTEKRYEEFYLELARVLAIKADYLSDLSEPELLLHIATDWPRSGERPSDEHICIVNENSVLIMHTLRPDAVGNYRGDNQIFDNEHQPAGYLRDLVETQTKYVGCYTACSGQSEVAAWIPIKSRGWMLGIHRSRAAMWAQARAGIRPLTMGFVAVCGILMPLSLLLLYRTFHVTQKRRQQAEQQLRKSQISLHMTQFSTDHAALEVYWATEDGRLAYINNLACEALGYSRAELLTLTIPDIVPDYNADKWREHWQQLKQRGSVTLEIRHIRKDGGIYPVETTVNYIEYEGVGYACGYSMDITKRKEMEQREQQRQAQLVHVARLSTIGEMASGLAHELNQPLTAISNYSNVCLRTMAKDPIDMGRIADSMNMVSSQSHRAGEIIRRVRGFVQKREPERVEVSINNLIRETVAFASGDMRDHGVTSAMELTAENPTVLADAVQIEQVVLNLIRNGIEAMTETDSDHRLLTIRSTVAADEFAEVSVGDRGHGMSNGVLERLFDSFFTTKEQGLGIGLSISRTIIERHSGRIWAQSDPDTGSTFKFTLPLATVTSPALMTTP